MVSSTSNVKEILQIKYTQGVRDQLQTKVPIRRKIRKAAAGEKFNGSYISDAVQLGRNSTGRAMREEDAYPEAGRATVRNTVIQPTWWRAKGAVTQTFNTRSKSNSFVNALTLEIMGLKDDAAVKFERYCQMDGSGLLGQISSINASSKSFTMPTYKAARLEEGLPVQFWTVGNTSDFDDASTTTMRANPSAANYYTVASIDFSNTSTTALVTLNETPASSIANDDYIVTAGALVVSGGQVFSTEEMGIAGIVGTGGQIFQTAAEINAQATDNFQGISPTTHPRWKSQSLDAGGGRLSPQILEKMFTQIKTFSGKPTSSVDMILVHHKQQELWRNARYTEELVHLMPDQGYEKGNRGQSGSTDETMYPAFGGVPLVDGRYFDEDKAYVVNSKEFRAIICEDFQMWNLGDGGFHKSYANKPQIEFEFYYYGQMATYCRNGMGVISNLDTAA